MPDRVSQRVEKKPGLNFPIKVIINFSVSATQDTQMYFKTACYNNNTDKAKVLRGFFFEALDIKNDDKYKKFMNPQIRDMKRHMFQKLKNINDDLENCYVKIMDQKIQKYIDIEMEKRKNDK